MGLIADGPILFSSILCGAVSSDQISHTKSLQSSTCSELNDVWYVRNSSKDTDNSRDGENQY